MTEDLLADVPSEGQQVGELADLVSTLNAIEDKGEETPAESLPDNKPDDKKKDDTPPSGDKDDDVPFHKHPRFKEITQQNRELKEQIATLSEKFETLTPKQQEAEVKVPDWWTRLYGNEEMTPGVTNAYKIYQTQSAQDRASIKQEILNELNQQGQKETQEQAKVNDWVNSEIDRIEEVADDRKVKFDRNAFKKHITDFPIVNSDGKLDFDKGFENYLKTLKEDKADTTTDVKKKIADTTITPDKGDGATKDYLTPADFRPQRRL